MKTNKTDSTLYGTAVHGGNGYGNLFALNTDGTGFTTADLSKVKTDPPLFA